MADAFAERPGGELGGFNWSSQHLVMGVVRDGCSGASAGGSCDAWADVVAGAAVGGEAGGSAAVLGGGRGRARRVRSRGRGRGRVAGGWQPGGSATAGGMPPISLAPLSGRYLSFAEREEIAILHAQRVGVREIARRLDRSPSTISRELRRNASTRTYRLGVSGDDGAVARGATREPPEGRQARRQRCAARSTCRNGSPA